MYELLIPNIQWEMNSTKNTKKKKFLENVLSLLVEEFKFQKIKLCNLWDHSFIWKIEIWIIKS